MITAKTTALIAAMSVLGTVAPAAFAQDLTDATGDVTVDDSFNRVTAEQSNSITKDVSQSIGQFAFGGASDDGTVEIDQSASQGFCEQINQQNAAAGGDATNTAENIIAGSVSGDDTEENQGVNCS